MLRGVRSQQEYVVQSVQTRRITRIKEELQ